MRKVMVLIVSMFLASCGGSSETSTVDSTAAPVDTVNVVDTVVVGGGGQSPHEMPVK